MFFLPYIFFLVFFVSSSIASSFCFFFFLASSSYVAVDERLVLAIEQLVQRHRTGHATDNPYSAATSPHATTDAAAKRPLALGAKLGDSLGRLGHQLWNNLTPRVYHDAAR
jgi:hypothetical protein